MRKLVISDIHGAFTALLQVLERASFEPSTDQLIFLGDVCDGYPDVTECIQFLSEVPNLVQIMGNHDKWTYDWLLNLNGKGYQHSGDYRCWHEQGGAATIASIEKHSAHDEVEAFLAKSVPYYIDNYKAFMHAGMDCDFPLKDQSPDYLMWDRSIVQDAKYVSMSTDPLITEFDEVFVGHSPTFYIGDKHTPINYNNVWLIDTGASYPKMKGRLSVMDVDTKAFWQSDPTADLYPGIAAR